MNKVIERTLEFVLPLCVHNMYICDISNDRTLQKTLHCKRHQAQISANGHLFSSGLVGQLYRKQLLVWAVFLNALYFGLQPRIERK